VSDAKFTADELLNQRFRSTAVHAGHWGSGKRDRSDIVKLGGPVEAGSGKRDGRDGKRDGSDIVKLGGPADVRAIFNRARYFDFGPPFAGAPWGGRPTLGPNVSRFPSAIPAGQRGGLG